MKKLILFVVLSLGILSGAQAQLMFLPGSISDKQITGGSVALSAAVIMPNGDRVAAYQTLAEVAKYAPRGIGARLVFKVRVYFNHPTQRPIDDKGRPTYFPRLYLDALEIPLTWDPVFGYVGSLDVDKLQPDTYQVSIEAKFPSSRNYEKLNLLVWKPTISASNSNSYLGANLEIAVAPYDQDPLTGPQDYFQVARWCARKSGFSADGTDTGVAGGMYQLAPVPVGYGSKSAGNLPAESQRPAEGERPTISEKDRQAIEQAFGSARQQPIAELVTTLVTYQGKQVPAWTILCSQDVTVQPMAGRWKDAGPIALKAGRTVSYIKTHGLKFEVLVKGIGRDGQPFTLTLKSADESGGGNQ